MKKRILSLLLVLVMVLSMLPVGVFADTLTEISDQAGLAAMTSGSYKLTKDIAITGDWTPITIESGNVVTLDGNGYTVTLNGKPLFAMLRGTVTNLILKGSVSSDTSPVGSLANKTTVATVRNCISYADVTYTGQAGSDWLGKHAAGLVGYTYSASDVIENCLYAGALTVGGANCYGSIANFYFYSATIKNCVGIGTDRIGTLEGTSISTIDAATNTVIADASGFAPANYLTSFNTNRNTTAGDLEWYIPEGGSALVLKRVEVADTPATTDEINALKAAVSTAEAAYSASKLYTASSYAAYNEALTAAKALVTKIDAGEAQTGKKVTNAATALSSAVLVERSLAAVAEPTEIIEVNNTYFNTYMESPQAGKYYKLTEDITIGSYWFGSTNTINCVIDGNGHTITLSGKSLWGTIGENGVVQNLGIKGSAQYSNNDTGAIAKDCSGLIVNCWSQAAVTSEGSNAVIKNTGSFVANLKSGGAIVNSYAAGSVTAKGSTGDGKVGALAGTSEVNTLVQNCYWLNTVNSSAVGAASGTVSGCAVKTDADFKDTSNVLALLNSGKGTYGKTWTQADSGYPHLGAAGNYTPPAPIELTYTPYEGYGSGSTSFTVSNGLILSLAEVLPSSDVRDDYYVGQFTYPGFNGEVAWVPQYTANGQGSHKVLASADGKLWVEGAGSLEIVLYDKSSWSGTQYEEELTRFTVTVSNITAEEIRLIPNGKYVTADGDGTYSVAGSGTVNVNVEIKVDGVWKSAPASLFSFTTAGNVFGTNSSTFFATEPGDIVVTAVGLDKTASVTVTSTYVAVTSIAPAPSGTYVLHGRDANTDSSGSFLDLTLAAGAGDVTVQPENASYRNSWTIASSDPTVAEYIQDFVRGIQPYKAGTTTLTATSNDPNLQSPITGTSTITLEYYNPVTSVTVDTSTTPTVKENASLELPITFTGPKSADGYHVSEPGMVWTFSADSTGEAEIVRNGKLGVIVGEEGSNEYCVANDSYKIMGVKAGTVNVTGTPVDTTGSAQPVTFTITVTKGDPEMPADVEEMVNDGISGAQSYLNTNAPNTYTFGYEWEIFSLVRSGAVIPQSKLDGYLDSVEETYTNAPTTEALLPTTLARVALTLGVLGQDASDFRGLDFVDMLCNSDSVGSSTSNMPIWALIALDSREYDTPANSQWDRDALIEEILTYQNTNGGFGLGSSDSISLDMTGMALQALAPYYSSNADVKTAVDKALIWLQGQMDSNGVFNNSAESTAQVLVGLTALGLDPIDPDNGFVKSVARNIISGLSSFQKDGSGFTFDGSLNKMATIQSLYALTSYDRFVGQKTRLYDLTDVEVTVATKLKNRIAEAESLKEEDYTAETWDALKKALADAKLVYADVNATENELQTADAALAAAIAALEKVNTDGGSSAEGTVTVYVTISNTGAVVMAQQTLDVPDVNENGMFDVDDALYTAHDKAYPGGAAAGYATAMASWGLSLSKLWGDDSGSFGYWLNDASCLSLTDEIADGDYLVAFVYSDKTTWSDAYTRFDKTAYTVTAGEALTVKLEKAGYDASWNTVFSALSGATIIPYTTDGKALDTSAYTVVDNKDGTYTITFTEDGVYQLIATDDSPIVPAVSTVTVSAATKSDPTDPTEDATEGKDTATKPNASGPNTGDSTNLVLLGCLMSVSLAAIVIVLMLKKKRSYK